MSETWVKLPPDHPKPLPVSILFGDEALEWKSEFQRMRTAVDALARDTQNLSCLDTIRQELTDMRAERMQANEHLYNISKSLEMIANIYRKGGPR